MNVPNDLRYTKEHEWVKIDSDVIMVGITDHAQSELGDIIFIEFPDQNQLVSKNEPFGTIEAVKTVADLFMPVSGEIISINSNIEDNPELINTDPHNDGWIIKIKIKDSSEIKSLLTEDKYKDLINV